MNSKPKRGCKRLCCAIVAMLTIIGLTGCGRSPAAREGKFLDAGKKYMAKKDYVRAQLSFKNAARSQPNSAEAYYQLGLAYLGTGESGIAAACFRKALLLDPKQRDAQLKLAGLLATTNDSKALAEAEKKLTGLLTENPEDATVLNTLALTELKLGDPQQAVEHLEQALARFPKNLESSEMLARIKLAQKDIKGAEEVLRQACLQDPKSAAAFDALGRFYSYTGKYDQARVEFDRALKIKPDDGPALFDRALLEKHSGNKSQAEQGFRRVAALPDPVYRPVYALFLFDEGRPQDGLRELERQFSANPDDRQLRALLVNGYQRFGRVADAEKTLNAALAKNKKDPEALLQRSELSLAAGRVDQAERDIAQVLNVRPDSAEAHYILSKVHQARGAELTRRQELAEAVRLSPGRLSYRIELARVLLANKAANSALELLDDKVVPPQQQKTLDFAVVRNWALIGLGRRADARRDVDQALTVSDNLEFRLQDAVLKAQEGRHPAALAQLDQILKVDPGNIAALELMASIYTAQKQVPLATQKIQKYAAENPKSAPVQFFLGKWLASHDNPAARAAFLAAKAADPGFVAADLELASLDVADGKVAEARRNLQALLAARPKDQEVRLRLAWAEENAANYREALDQYRAVLKAEPNNVVALNNSAYLLAARLNQPDEALKYAQQAKELMPDNLGVDDTIGWAFYGKGLYSTALKHLEPAAAGPNGVPTARYHLGMTYMRLGETKRGRQVLTDALKTFPQLPEAQMARAVLAETNHN